MNLVDLQCVPQVTVAIPFRWDRSARTNYCFFSTASLFSSVVIAASSLSSAA
jgi:hypothetical protein